MSDEVDTMARSTPEKLESHNLESQGAQKGAPEPVAIVGMGCRWPGGVRDSPGLWELLRNKRFGYRDYGDHRFSSQGFYHLHADRPGSVSTRGGFLLTEDARLFEPSFFGIQPLEVETMDASQRKLLEVIYEAFENAGETWDQFSGSKTGVFVGNFTTEHTVIQSRDSDHPRPYVTTGSSLSLLSNRISYIFNLKGPSLTIDTACSSSMYALHLAINAMRNGDCDSAIIAASNWIIDPTMQIMMNKLGALSSTPACHTFDEAADGYARGEGFAAIYLKRTSVAVLEGSPIRAVIRGTAINANGRTGGITHPSKAGQEAVIREAYRNAGGLPLADTTFFECHGTGTPVGDPIEVEAIGNVFSPVKAPGEPLYIGSVKTNLGHTESASAIAGIMKVVLALEAGVIPPSIGITNLNPRIDFDKTNVQVITDITPWPKSKLRRASINSFGYGGANGHCIIDHVSNVLPNYVKPGLAINKPVSKHAPNGHATNGHAINGHGKDGHASNGHLTNGRHTNGSNGFNGHTANGNRSSALQQSVVPAHSPVIKSISATPHADADTRQWVLLPFSAHNEASLNLNIAALSSVFNSHGPSLADVAFTLAAKRTRFTQRSFRIIDKQDPITGLGVEQPTTTSPANPARLSCSLDKGPSGMEWVVNFSTITFSGTRSIGLIDLLSSWSVRPSAVVGHSSGEMATAYAAGGLTAAEALAAAFFRGQVVAKNEQRGAMLAVGLGLEELEAMNYLKGREDSIKVAAISSPGSLTLSGDFDAIEEVAKVMTEASVFNRLLQTGGNAYHSHHMSVLGGDYSDSLTDGLVKLQNAGVLDPSQKYPHIPWVSSVTPDKGSAGLQPDPSYWRSNLESPVQFSSAVRKLMALEDTPIDLLIEIGPHAALKGPYNQILKDMGLTTPYSSSLVRNEHGQRSLLQLAGTLFSLNASIDLVSVNSLDATHGQHLVHGCTATDLPPYQYSYGPVSYYESRFSKEYRSRSVCRHDLIGSKVSAVFHASTIFIRPNTFPVTLGFDRNGATSFDTRTSDAVFPAAGYVAMTIEVASRAHQEFVDAPPTVGTSLRNVSINSALRIPEDDYGVEILITLDLADAATATLPAWANFSISSVSRNSDVWTEHCHGAVRVHVSSDREYAVMSTSMDARTLDKRAWYRKFTQLGLGYGPAFQGLSDIEADPTENMARAKLALNTTAGTVSFACHGGQIDVAGTAFVPIHISQLHLKHGNEEDWGTGIAKGELRGLRGAYAKLQLLTQSGSLVLDVDSLRCISYGDSPAPDGAKHGLPPFSSPLTRLEWKPDVRSLSYSKARDFFPPPKENVDRADLFHSIHTIATLVVVDIHENYGNLADFANASDQIRFFLAWVKRRVEQDETEAMITALRLSRHERQQQLDSLYATTSELIEVKIAQTLHRDMEDILYERRTGVEVLVKEGLLSALYESGLAMTGAYPQLLRILDCLGHANPNQRILELGAGTGGATRVAMKALRDEKSGIKRYDDYAFTDISPGFLTAAREFMAPFHDISFSVLNIEEAPLEQGHGTLYDLVLASQCLHATPSISKTLANCRKLLKPGGKLVLVENTQNAIGHGVVLGTLTGYWDGVPDGRIDSPFLDIDSWDGALKAAGFSGAEVVLDDYPRPHNTASTIVSTILQPGSQGKQEAKVQAREQVQAVHLLHGRNGALALLHALAKELESRDIPCQILPLECALETVAADSRIVAFLDGENLLLNADAQRLALFQHLARSASSMVWITSGGLIQGNNADGALLSGLLRTIGTENPFSKFLSIDIDVPDFTVGDAAELRALVRSIADKEVALQSTDPSNNDQREDREFAWHEGCFWVSRLVPDAELSEQHIMASMPASRTEPRPIDSQGPVRAAYETPGILTSLYFRPYQELWQPLPDDWIEVKVAAVGLNWKDLGIAAGRFDANNLSSEYSGIVTQIGSSAAKDCGLSVGDPVYGMGRGHFGNYTRVLACYAQKLQASDDLVEVAIMPLAFMTAVYAFDHATLLKRGEKGREEKARLLIEEMQVPASNIFSSRDPSDLMRAAKAVSGGRGFDVILSAARGEEMLYESFKALAPLGRLIDVGRMDVLDSKRLGLELFQKSISFSSFDLGLVLDANPDLGVSLMKSVDKYYRAGNISPIKPFSVSDVSQLDQVLLGFSKGTHVGKHVISFLDPKSLVRMVPAAPAARFDPDAQYIITGGLGGLGRSIIRWMGSRGARHLVVLSRSGASTAEAKILIKDLAARGVSVRSMVCDVGVRGQVVQAVRDISSSAQWPIKGLIHAAMSLQDISFDKLSLEQWNRSLAAKVWGTKHLHEATLSLPLDFFVMTTSLESVLALATQSAYTAANNFQELFARQRRAAGLPASTAAFGLITDVGALGRSATTVNMMARNRVLGVTEDKFLRLLEPAFLDGCGHGTSRSTEESLDPLSSVGLVTCLDPAAMAAKKREDGGAESVPPRWYSDGRVSVIMRAFEDAYRHADDSSKDNGAGGSASSSAVAQLRDQFDEHIRAGPEDGRAEALSLVTQAIAAAVAGMLSIDMAGVSPAKTMADYGVDSLIAAELRNWFNLAFRANISLLDLLDTHTSMEKLAGIVVDAALERARDAEEGKE
ncbi:hypothetical protein DL771_005684 [Monosporascus sp. 5C6A]|nr:hypothetical protein DL771_005684 [Monosporascus sp. 5C6A]